MSLRNLWSVSYWFSQPQTLRGAEMWVWVGIFLILILGGIILRIVREYQSSRGRKEAMRRFSNLGLTMGLLGLIWLFVRQEIVPFLSWRFWLLFWLVGLIWWLYKVIWYGVKRLPAIEEEQREKALKDKYLPKSN